MQFTNVVGGLVLSVAAVQAMTIPIVGPVANTVTEGLKTATEKLPVPVVGQGASIVNTVLNPKIAREAMRAREAMTIPIVGPVVNTVTEGLTTATEKLPVPVVGQGASIVNTVLNPKIAREAMRAREAMTIPVAGPVVNTVTEGLKTATEKLPVPVVGQGASIANTVLNPKIARDIPVVSPVLSTVTGGLATGAEKIPDLGQLSSITNTVVDPKKPNESRDIPIVSPLLDGVTGTVDSIPIASGSADSGTDRSAAVNVINGNVDPTLNVINLA